MTESRPVSPEGPAPLPCPWCGEEPTAHFLPGARYNIYCDDSRCSVNPEMTADSPAEAIARWNRRPSRSAGSPETPRKPIGLTAATSWVRHEVEKLLARLEKVPRVDVYIDHAPFRAHVAEEDDPGGRYVRFADLCEAIGPFVLAAPTTRTTTNQEDSDRLDWLEAAGKSPTRCVGLDYQPKIGLMPTDRWRIHFNGVGYLAHEPTLREAIDAARSTPAAQET